MKFLIYDIETLKEMFLVGIYDVQTGEYIEFEISEGINQITGFINYIDSHSDYYWVGFNCLRFDGQVVEWIIRRSEFWEEKAALEISALIHQKAQDVIDDSNYNIAPEYKDYQVSFKQIDLFTIWHFNNENRRTSLKAVEFAINFENIEEMPLHHAKENLTAEEKTNIRMYCRNDVMATYAFFKITRGDTDIDIFKGKDKLADRLIMRDEFGLDCLNWDDVKIGAEWNKMDYMRLTGKKEEDLYPEKVNHYFGKRFRRFFPPTVTFKTPQMRRFMDNLGKQFMLNEKQEFKFIFNDELAATIAKGGIHSNEKGRFLKPKPDEIYYQCDIGSQYPNAIRKFKIEPKHLPGWNNLIVSKIERRLNYKRLYKETKDPKYNSLQEMGKLSLNGGSYGRLNTKGDWQRDPSCMMQVTIGCQLEIMMIVETLILEGFRVVSLNTDGFDIIIPRNRDQEFKKIIAEFEKIIGNDVLGNFEFTEFKWIAQTSVNDYIAMKMDGSVKTKGDFEIDKELHKNTSMRIVPIALKEYFTKGTPVEQMIKNHRNIYDFCIRQKASGNFHYEGVNGNVTTVYNKLIRYFVSNTGEKLYKIKNPDYISGAPERAQVEAGKWLCQVRNYLPKETKVEDCDIDYEFYIQKVENIIVKIDKTYRRQQIKDKQQLTLW